MSKIDKIIEREKLYSTEGRKGVENLAILCRNLGYHDHTHFGQFSHKASFGDLIEFLEDNPGAIQNMIEWIRDNEDAYDLEDHDDDQETD